MNRRETLLQLAAAGLALAPAASAGAETDRLGPVLPRRPLGKTGEQVTCLGLGGYHIGWVDDEKTVRATIEAALEEGVRFFDNAESYGQGRSEERYGKYLVPQYRDQVFIMTKTGARDPATARAHLEGALSRMKLEMVDLWQLHSLESPDDADDRVAKGLLDVALKAREEGKVRYIGFTGHASPYAHTRMMEHEVAARECVACQFPVNPVDAAAKHSFIGTTLPAAQKHGISVLAMKTLADGRFFGSKVMNGKEMWTLDDPVVPDVITIAECIHFALSLPITTLITGAENPDLLREKAELVRAFSKMGAGKRMALAKRVADFAADGKVEYYKDAALRLPGTTN